MKSNMKQWLLKQIRREISYLGEYCNNSPFDKFSYNLYLIMITIFYKS